MNGLPDAHDRLIDAEREVRRLTEENARLKGLLRAYEWIADDYGSSCLACGTPFEVGHAPNCRLKAAIG